MAFMKIGRSFHFDASHYLPHYAGDCARLHGHTYILEFVVEGEVNPDGMVIDFLDLERKVKAAVLDKLDHRNLNEFFAIPTAENVALWIFHELEKEIPVSSVKLYEGLGKWAVVEKNALL